jgi:hypothetical protein
VTGTLVVDASLVMALLTSSSDTMTTWANGLLDGADLVAPHLMPAEVHAVKLGSRRHEFRKPELGPARSQVG